VLVAATDAATVLLIDAVSFAASAASVAATVAGPARRDVPAEDPAEATSYLGQLEAGARYVRTNRLALGIVLMLFVTNLIDQANATVLVPVWSREIYGSPVGIGLVVGVARGRRGGRQSRLRRAGPAAAPLRPVRDRLPHRRRPATGGAGPRLTTVDDSWRRLCGRGRSVRVQPDPGRRHV